MAKWPSLAALAVEKITFVNIYISDLQTYTTFSKAYKTHNSHTPSDKCNWSSDNLSCTIYSYMDTSRLYIAIVLLTIVYIHHFGFLCIELAGSSKWST